MQKGIRSYQNLENLSPGDPVLEADVVGIDKAIGVAPECPLGGSYSFMSEIPAEGVPFATCINYDANSGIVDSNQAHTPVVPGSNF